MSSDLSSDTFKEENSSLLAKHAGDHGVDEGGECLCCGEVFVRCDFWLTFLDVKLRAAPWVLSTICAWLLQGVGRGHEASVESGMEEIGEVLYDGPMEVGDVGQGYY